MDGSFYCKNTPFSIAPSFNCKKPPSFHSPFILLQKPPFVPLPSLHYIAKNRSLQKHTLRSIAKTTPCKNPPLAKDRKKTPLQKTFVPLHKTPPLHSIAKIVLDFERRNLKSM
jgi:hypothetical protein